MNKISLIVTSLICMIVLSFMCMGSRAEAALKPNTAGGWKLVTENNPCMMDDKDMTRITTALQEHGDNFEVLGLIATQVVSGANYMYLVYGTPANEAIPGYYFVKVYQDLKGNSSITKITPIDVANIQTGTALKKGMTGGWTIQGTGKAGMFADQTAQVTFDTINNGDVLYNPVALLATQLVAGTNYRALCIGMDDNLYAVTWYVDLQGNVSLTSADCVNISAYSK